ncbi:MAG: hypothetical protein AAGF10_01830 [Verrucomicrobiota bacterium]
MPTISASRAGAFVAGALVAVLIIALWQSKPADSPEMTMTVKAVPVASPPDQQPPPAVNPESVAGSYPKTDTALTSLPRISAEYRNTIGFRGYVEAMRSRGGRFFLYDDARNKLLAEVDPLGGRLSLIEPESLRGLSPRLRELSHEPEAAAVLAKHRAQVQAVRLELVLMLPAQLEAEALQRLRQARAEGRIPTGDWKRLEGEYLRQGGRVILRLERAVGAGGLSVPFRYDLAL